MNNKFKVQYLILREVNYIMPENRGGCGCGFGFGGDCCWIIILILIICCCCGNNNGCC